MPLQRITKRKTSKFRTILRPLFPGYVFASLEFNSSLWQRVKNTRGVTRVVRFGPKPSQVPTEIISQLLACCDGDLVFQRDIKFKTDNYVTITHGPMAGFIGRIIDIDPKNCINILFDFMGKISRLTIDGSSLKSAQ
jgi:transcriptional antiterminator RfaH